MTSTCGDKKVKQKLFVVISHKRNLQPGVVVVMCLDIDVFWIRVWVDGPVQVEICAWITKSMNRCCSAR